MLGFQNGLEIVGELLARIAKYDDLLQELSLNPASVCSFHLLSLWWKDPKLILLRQELFLSVASSDPAM